MYITRQNYSGTLFIQTLIIRTLDYPNTKFNALYVSTRVCFITIFEQSSVYAFYMYILDYPNTFSPN